MTDPVAHILASARAADATIVLPEGRDPRIREGALRAAAEGLGRMILIDGDPDEDPLPPEVEIVSSHDLARLDRYASSFLDIRGPKCDGIEQGLLAMQSPLGQAAMMVRLGEASGTVGGAASTTADVVRTALQIIGPASGVEVVSSSFLMLFAPPLDGPAVFADCGLVLQPTAEELSDIAISAAETLVAMTGQTPRIAMLSFSSHGSVVEHAHESLPRIRKAVALVRERRPDLIVEGELQFDAALLPEIGRSKAPSSALGDQGANVFVFPSLSAGNIGYKIAQRVGNARAFGPIMQGLARPANDLSRGCDADDVYHMIAVTAAQVAMARSGAGPSRTQENVVA